MKELPGLVFFIWSLLVTVFSTSYLAAQSLPDGWWLQGSPEKVLAKAQAINQNWAFFHGEKIGSTLSKITDPFAGTNDNERTDFFQRRNADGSVETKRIHLAKKYESMTYELKNGKYFCAAGRIIKMEYDEGDNLEKIIAVTGKFDHPYNFKILESEMVDTNDCLVIVRYMTPSFLDATKAVYYKGYTKEQEAASGGDFRKFIRSETDFFFRKSDGVAFGFIQRNHLGEQLEDQVYDRVDINLPIPDREFFLPGGDIKIAKSIHEFLKIVSEAMAGNLAKARKNPAATLSEKRVSELLWAADLPKALAQAKAESKIVLLDFTGSDWCVWCIKFDDDILSQPEFAAYAKTNLVMVLLDFPNAKQQSDALKKTNQVLQEKFKVDGFPTYVALNPDGKEIGRQVGYLSGGPQAFIAELKYFGKQ
jgi:thioredoxin-related protein